MIFKVGEQILHNVTRHKLYALRLVSLSYLILS